MCYQIYWSDLLKNAWTNEKFIQKIEPLNVEKKLPVGSNGIKNVKTNKIDDKWIKSPVLR